MSLLIKDEKLLEKHHEILKKSRTLSEKKFDCNPVYNQKHTKTKTKFYNGKIDTRFHSNKIPKEGSVCICL